MRSRFPLLLKKRGSRRSGSPGWGLSGELLYHGVFIAVGIFATWLHVTNVLVPDWKRYRSTESYVQAECVVVDGRIASRSSLTGTEYRAECQVQVARPVGRGSAETAPSESDSTDEGEAAENAGAAPPLMSPPLWASAGLFTPSQRDARRDLQRHLDSADQSSASDSSDDTETTAKNAEPATRIACWVDPDNPAAVTLNRGWRWWPWWVLPIPVSLFVLGAVGAARTIRDAGISPESRIANRPQQAKGMLGILPPLEPITDSPGVRLLYRLPIEGGAGWRLAGSATVGIVWNLLAGFFLIEVLIDHIAGRPNWTVTLIVTPLAITGGWLASMMIRDAWKATGVGVTQIEVSDHPFLPGETYQGILIQAGQFRGRSLKASLVCQEIATYQQGTDSRTSAEEVYRSELIAQRRFEVLPGEAFEVPFELSLPKDRMHSFISDHNEIRWIIEVRCSPIRWPDFVKRFQLIMAPPTGWPVVKEINRRDLPATQEAGEVVEATS